MQQESTETEVACPLIMNVDDKILESFCSCVAEVHAFCPALFIPVGLCGAE